VDQFAFLEGTPLPADVQAKIFRENARRILASARPRSEVNSLGSSNTPVVVSAREFWEVTSGRTGEWKK